MNVGSDHADDGGNDAHRAEREADNFQHVVGIQLVRGCDSGRSLLIICGQLNSSCSGDECAGSMRQRNHQIHSQNRQRRKAEEHCACERVAQAAADGHGILIGMGLVHHDRLPPCAAFVRAAIYVISHVRNGFMQRSSAVGDIIARTAKFCKLLLSKFVKA